MSSDKEHWNRCRFVPSSERGHYESFFQRANHDERPLAFWIRYTIFSPRKRPDQAVGELWAIYFDGERNHIAAAKSVFPLSECAFSDTGLEARIGDSTLDDGALSGRAESSAHRIEWSLQYRSSEPPLLLLPERLYERSLPKAKAVVGSPNAIFTGSIAVDDEKISIDDWKGSQNHNWGSRHTDAYAWGQVAGFDNAPDAFFECGTARVRIGPFWTPWLTLLVLRLEGRELALNTFGQSLRAHGRYDFFTWSFESHSPDVRLKGRMTAPASAFVGLAYGNPPGGTKTCLNTKLSSCELAVHQIGQPLRTLRSEHRAAFEILTDDKTHGVPVVA
jgi:hypothetical protein